MVAERNVLRFCLLRQHPCRLVRKQDMLVLKDHSKLFRSAQGPYRAGHGILPAEFFKGFIGKEEADLVPCGQFFAAVRSAAV